MGDRERIRIAQGKQLILQYVLFQWVQATMFLKSCRLGIEYYCCCYSFSDIAGLCVRFNQVRSPSIPKVLVIFIMIFFYPVNALILKWYAEDIVVYTSKVSLPSCKLYFTSKFVRIITVFFVSFPALLHVPLPI